MNDYKKIKQQDYNKTQKRCAKNIGKFSTIGREENVDPRHN